MSINHGAVNETDNNSNCAHCPANLAWGFVAFMQQRMQPMEQSCIVNCWSPCFGKICWVLYIHLFFYSSYNIMIWVSLFVCPHGGDHTKSTTVCVQLVVVAFGNMTSIVDVEKLLACCSRSILFRASMFRAVTDLSECRPQIIFLLSFENNFSKNWGPKRRCPVDPRLWRF